METFSPQENQAKYSTNGSDVIERHSVTPFAALSFCVISIDKYATRYVSNSAKSGLSSDVMKMSDYYQRAKYILIDWNIKEGANVTDALHELYNIMNALDNGHIKHIPNICQNVIFLAMKIN